MNQIISGLLSGAVATIPMTLLMKAIHLSLPHEQRNQPAPPRQITMKAAEVAGVEEHMDEPARVVSTAVSHFGYGATAGAAYPALEEKLPGTPAARGAVLGLGVWAVSYLGWLPAAGVLPSATRWPAGRNFMMIAAHVVWGVATGLVYDQLQRRPATKVVRHQQAQQETEEPAEVAYYGA